MRKCVCVCGACHRPRTTLHPPQVVYTLKLTDVNGNEISIARRWSAVQAFAKQAKSAPHLVQIVHDTKLLAVLAVLAVLARLRRCLHGLVLRSGC